MKVAPGFSPGKEGDDAHAVLLAWANPAPNHDPRVIFPMLIRRETADDHTAIHEVNRLAFGAPPEAELVDALRRNGQLLISLVAEIDRNERSRAIVSAVLSLGEALGMRVIAEGIETAEQRAELLRLGCDAGQGYAFSPPLPPDELTAYITSRNTTPT